MDRLGAMQTFLRVAELGSFAAVAEQGGVARSVITRQIAALEAHLGVKLLTRSTRSLSLTPEGTAFLERCRVILNLVEAAETDVAEHRAVPRGPIRLGLPLAFGLRRVAPLLLEFADRYPEISFDVDYTDRRVDLVEEAVDLAIRITGRLDPADVVRRLGTCRMYAVASHDYVARHGAPAHPRELANHECLVYTNDPRGATWQFLVEGRVESLAVRGRITANNGDALTAAAARGFGIALAPDFVVEPHAATVRRVLEAFPSPDLGIYAVLPSNRYVPHRVRVLMDFLQSRLQAVAEGDAARGYAAAQADSRAATAP
jgi:DNA-binding transcriptional LysR family regulator